MLHGALLGSVLTIIVLQLWLAKSPSKKAFWTGVCLWVSGVIGFEIITVIK